MTDLIKNNMKHCLEFMGKEDPTQTSDDTLAQLGIIMPDIDDPTTEITSRLVCEVMDDMVWPAMGKTQAAVCKSAVTTHNVVIKHYKKLDENNDVVRRESEAREAIRVVLRRREYLDR